MDSDDNIEIPDDFFDFDLSEHQAVNNRIATRYIRNDIKVTLCKNCLFNFGRKTPVDLIDISSRGVLIRSNQKLSIHDKVTLDLKFECGKTFKISAKVARRLTLPNDQYGIKFDRCNDELGDYLLETQKELIFK